MPRFPLAVPIAVPGLNFRRDPALVEATGWRRVARLAMGGVELIGVGLLVPLGILALVWPVGFALKFVVWIVRAVFP